MIRFRHALLAICLVLVVHAIALVEDLYHSIDWFDVPMHFFGGYAIALLGLATYGWIAERVDIRQRVHKQAVFANVLLQCIFVVGFVMLVGVAWEWYEFIFDQLGSAFSTKYSVAQMGLPDTMDDLLNDMVGAMVGWILWRKTS